MNVNMSENAQIIYFFGPEVEIHKLFHFLLVLDSVNIWEYFYFHWFGYHAVMNPNFKILRNP